MLGFPERNQRKTLWHGVCETHGSEHSVPETFELKFPEVNMLWTILTVVLVLWLLGFLVGNVGGLIHLLLVVAGVIFLIQLLSGRRRIV